MLRAESEQQPSITLSERLRHYFVESATNVAALVIAVCGVIITIILDGGLASNVQHAFQVWVVGGLLIVVTLTILYVLQLYAMYSERRRLEKVEADLRSAQSLISELQKTSLTDREAIAAANQAVGNARAATHQIYHWISRYFAELEPSHTALDTNILHLSSSLAMHRPVLNVDIFNTTKAFESLLLHICNTAASVLAAKKQIPRESLSVNIKVLRNVPRGLSYRTLSRSSGGTNYTERVAADELLAQAEKLVDNNFYYSSILIEGIGTDMHYLLANIEDLIPNIHYPFDEPEAQSAPKLYKSCLIVPIMGSASPVYADAPLPYHGAYKVFRKTEHILGFMCVDSVNAEEFDSDYDRNIMNQLATQAFNAIRDFSCILGIAGEAATASLATQGGGHNDGGRAE